jgi:ABC-type multidrug transport system permease subunit
MTLENRVLLFVIFADALIIGLSVWTHSTIINNTERRLGFFKMLSFKMWLFGLAVALFCGYELYQWYAVKQLYFGRVGPGMEVSLTDHPALFALLGILYSLAFMMFASGTLFGVAKLCGIIRPE